MDAGKLQVALRKQGIHVHESDPVLETAAICDVVLADALKSMEGIVKRSADQITAAHVQAEASARKVAGDIINNAAAWLEGRFKATAEETLTGMLAELRQETAKAEAASRIAVRAAWFIGVVGAGFLSLAAGYGIAALKL